MNYHLLPLSTQERRALDWLWRWACARLTRLKRRRKYRPPGEPIGTNEAEVLMALVALRDASAVLMGPIEPRRQRTAKKGHLRPFDGTSGSFLGIKV